MRLKSPARSSSSSPVWISICRSSSPAPIRAAPACNSRIGTVMRRARSSAANVARTSAKASSAPVRNIEP